MRLTKTLLRRLLATAALLCAWLPSVAVEVDNLYTVSVTPETGERLTPPEAYAQALQAVLVRVTGQEAAATDEDLLDLFPVPANYVLRYRRGEENALVISLDGEAIEARLRSTGYPVWDSDRPLTLVWLAVEWSPGERQLIAAEDDPRARSSASRPNAVREAALRDSIMNAAERRGIPIQFPRLDESEQLTVTVSDVWGGFDDALLEASRPYGSSSILVGRIRADELFNHRWSYYYLGQRLTWQGTEQTAVDLLADALAERFSYAGNEPTETLSLTITGVSSIDAYGTIERTLDTLGIIDEYRLDRVAGDQLRYSVTVPGGRERLASALEFSGVLARSDWLGASEYFGSDGGADALVYRFDPVAADRDDPAATPLDGSGIARPAQGRRLQ